MGKYKTVFLANVVVFIALGALMSQLGFAGVGAVAVIQGSINLVCALIVAVPGEKKYLVQGYLICGGLLLLIGFSLCSAFPLKL